MPANSQGITSFNLRVGVDEFLYSNVSTTGAQATFGLPPQMATYRGVVIFQVVPLSGTLTSVVGQIEQSLIPEPVTPGVALPSAFGIFNKLANFSASPATLSAYSGIAFATTTNNIPIAIDLSGAGGTGKFRINFTTVTLGTATGFNVYARIG